MGSRVCQLTMDAATLFLFALVSLAKGQTPLDCDEILEENVRLKEEIKWLNDVIRNNITQLTEMIQYNVIRITANEGNIQDNAGSIQHNAVNIQNNAGNIEDNADNIGLVDSKVNSNSGQIVSTNRRIDENKAYIDQNTENIDQNRDIIDNLHLAPIGTISAWVTKPSKEAREEDLVSLPDGWLRCDGATIPEPSVWAGQHTPNLNGEKRFLRGGSDSEVLTMEEDQMQDHEHRVSDPGHSHSYVDKYPQLFTGDNGYDGLADYDRTDDRLDKSHNSESESSPTGLTVDGITSEYRFGSETRPKNMNVVYIMRVW